MPELKNSADLIINPNSFAYIYKQTLPQNKFFYIFSKKLLTYPKLYAILNKYFGSALNIAEWSSQVARRAHNPKVVGSNPASATTFLLKVKSFGFLPLSNTIADIKTMLLLKGNPPDWYRRMTLVSVLKIKKIVLLTILQLCVSQLVWMFGSLATVSVYFRL